MSATEVPAELAEAYRHTQYRLQVEGDEIVIRIGKPCDAMAAILRALGADGGIFITAENPFSQALSEFENAERQERLLKDLRALNAVIFDGAGHGDDPNWPAEASYAAIGITCNQACELGTKYDQNAIVWIDATGTGELIFLR